jgi:LmbE family N-acetylglucosaminyl deacetylase
LDEPLKLLCVTAHPDDETLATGATLALYSRQGVETYVVTATRGEAGRMGTTGERPPTHVVGQVREREERAAGRVLGIRGVWFLGCRDGEVDRADYRIVIREIARHVRRLRPQVLVTLPPYGSDGHPDHVAVSQLAASAMLRAADADYEPGLGAAHVVSKLYYIVWTRAIWETYRAAFGTARAVAPWPDWAVTALLDTTGVWDIVWEAVKCHRSQLAGHSGIADLREEDHRLLWGIQRYYRALSLVNGGGRREGDLFEGLR